MKFLLVAVNAKYIHSNLAVRCLKSYAKKYKDEIEIREYTINHQLDDIVKDIYLRKPDVIGFSCYIWNIVYVKQLLGELPKLLPGIKLWLGGPEASFEAKMLLEEFPQITGILLGEGEKTFLNLMKYYKGVLLSLSEIDGLFYRDQMEVFKTREPQDQLDMDTIPFFYENLEDLKHKIIYYESSRGCPYSCSYCLSSVESPPHPRSAENINKKVRFRDRELVKTELDFFLKNEVLQVKFTDRTFNCKHSHAIAIWEHILEHDNGITNFHFEVSADLLNEEELRLLEKMRPGLMQLEVGVQSTALKTIKEIRRTMDLEKLKANVTRIHSYGNIHLHLDLIAGLPYEDYESFAHSFNEIYALMPEQLQLGFLKVLKGSYMHQMADRYGIVYKNIPPYEVLYTKWISYEELLALKGLEEMVEIYYNSRQYSTTMGELVKCFPTSFHMYESLSAYYEEFHLFDRCLSRLEKYEVLFNFITVYAPNKLEMFRDLLMYDLYLREKIKSRPSFSKDQSPYKSAIKNFFMKEETVERYLSGYDGYTSKQISNMTHIEVFSRDGKEEYILFDYQNRDPLTYNAKTFKISGEDLWTEYKR